MILSEVLKHINYETLAGTTGVNVKKLTIDSRMAAKDSLFICLKGLKEDGHRYIADAASLGASAVLVQDADCDFPEGLTAIKVADTREAMSYAAANFCGNPAERLRITGVTGTKGKTSSTYFMEAVLNEAGCKTGVIGTIDIRIGDEVLNVPHIAPTTPDPIELHGIFAKMEKAGVTDVIMEVSSHALELKKVAGIRFASGIFTNLAHDHLDFHGDMESYKLAKAKLFKLCERGVINMDSEYGQFMKEACEGEVTTFSIDGESQLQAVGLDYVRDGVYFDLKINGLAEKFFIPIQGKFSVYNALGVIGAALGLGIPPEVVKSGLGKTKTVLGRLQSVPNGLGFNVIVDYAHTPDSLNIIETVRGFTRGRVITVFGCGGDRDKTKRPLMGRVAGELSDYCIITSDNPRTEDPAQIIEQAEAGIIGTGCAYEKIVDRKEAIFRAVELAKPGDSVIIAGKGHENYQVFADHTIHFDDTEEALEALEERGGKT